MPVQTVFKRYEMKYVLSREQQKMVLKAMEPYMKLDDYGKTLIRNIYFDTDDYLLIRRSIEKPAYKEKLRVRCYGNAESKKPVFVELKKKYKKIVYKRRIVLSENEALKWLQGERHCKSNSQITQEIDYFLSFYKALKPAAYISYEREAYYSQQYPDLRITFDSNILCRTSNLTLEKDGGDPVLPQENVLMEIKSGGAVPLWMTDVLSHEHIYKTSFSKYGAAYRSLIFPQINKGDFHYA